MPHPYQENSYNSTVSTHNIFFTRSREEISDQTTIDELA
jgi:hypothetical protein